MKHKVNIRLAQASDVTCLNAALRALSRDLGDTHTASDADIAQAGFGSEPVFRAQIVFRNDIAVGVATYSPLFSTIRGVAGTNVTDLWVAASERGAGLGPKILAAMRDDARAVWGARFTRLLVYRDNPRAMTFYKRMGFKEAAGEAVMLLEGAAFEMIGVTG